MTTFGEQTLALALLAVVALAAPVRATAPMEAEGAATLLGPEVQYQHDLAVPDKVHGVWMAVRGIPGTAFELHVRFDDGTGRAPRRPSRPSSS